MHKALVTGGAGFIGSHLTDALIERGYEVHIVDNFTAGRKEERINPRAVLHEHDVRDIDALKQSMEGAVFVFHLAALPRVQDSIDHPIETHDVNVGGTLCVLEAARAAGVKKVVFASSAAVYGDHEIMPLQEIYPARPKSPYGLHKYIGECTGALWSELYQQPFVALRYFNVYGSRFDPNGPYALVVGKFIELYHQGKPLTIAGDGSNTRDYIHVSDVARANILAAESDGVGNGEIINIGSGVETSVLDLAGMIGGTAVSIEARIEPKWSFADITRAKQLIAWQPSIEINEGIQMLKNTTSNS